MPTTNSHANRAMIEADRRRTACVFLRAIASPLSDCLGSRCFTLRAKGVSHVRHLVAVGIVFIGGLLTGLLWPAFAQADDSVGLVAKDIEFFEKRVRPLLVEHCFECHSSEEKNGGLLLDAPDALRAGGDSGPAIVPGQPEKSLLIEAVRYKNRDLQMPPKMPLSDAEVAVLVEWIQRGAPDPRAAASSTVTGKVMGISLEEGRKFWSFQPLNDPALPAVVDPAWVRTPVDAFILAELEKRSIEPARVADKRTLLRRVTLDLIGLPPTPTEVEAFLADQSPDAYERVVDRLLASPQYGVRWGRHWLDVARYADSNGLDENLAFGVAWRYRDYVVDAFNSDKPFDRFLTEQIAGDLLPDQSAHTHVATAFLVLGAKVLAEPDREKLTMDTIDEQIDTMGKAFLGMTLGCARCHDHKFDPISQADYYGLAAIFKSTKTFGDSNTGAIKHWHEISLATPEEKERIKAIESAIAEKQKAAASFKNKAIAAVRDQAREQAVDYLNISLMFNPDTPLTEVAMLAAPLGLHPRILHHCRRHLAFHADDPFFAKWHEVNNALPARIASVCETTDEPAAALPDTSGRPPEPTAEVADDKVASTLRSHPNRVSEYYGPLFQAARDWAEAKKKDSQLKPHADPQVMAAHAALFDTSGFLTVPAKVGFALDEIALAEYNRLAEEARVLESFAPDMPSAMSVSENAVQASIPIHIRGSHRNLGQNIERAFPAVMLTSRVRPIMPRHSSGRLELAQWLTNSTHPLTARVYVNRIWRWHFGRGLVGSTENFGVLGDRPSHPELLDWLARQLIETGWSTRHMHRLILLSSTYQLASAHAPGSEQARRAEQADPENLLWSKFRVQRLDAEQIRDSILLVAGQLDQSLGGKTVPLRNRQFVFDHTSIDHTRYESLRRAIYLPVIRNNLYTLFEQFDFPDPTMPTGSRHTTTVAPQALLLMNSDLVIDAADRLSQQLVGEQGDTASRVQALYRRVLGRPAETEEVEAIEQFIAKAKAELAKAAGDATESAVKEQQAWSLACQSVMVSNEFFMIR